MRIQHKITTPVFYDWIGKNGWSLSLNEIIEVPDEYALLEKFRSAYAEGYFDVLDFNEDDFDIVIQKELKEAGGGGGSGDEFQVDKFSVTAPGQTNFSLSKTPTNNNKVVCIISGIPQEPILDYYVVGTTLVYTERHFVLDVTDWVEAIYAS